MGLRVGRLTSLHLHPCSYVMSLTDDLVIIYLTIFETMGSRVQVFIFQVPRSPLFTQSPMIYILTIRLVVGTERLSGSFLSYPSPTNSFETLSLFFIIHNHKFVGSRVHKMPQIQIALVRPHHLCAFPNMYLVWFNSNN
jgi:hypothetical protein